MSRAGRLLMILLIAIALLAPSATLAHEHREVGPFEFTVGFMHEPAFEHEQNGIWLRVERHDSGEPVEGLAGSLRAEVIKGAQQRELELRPAWNEPGVYTAVFYPTEPGDYTFRFTGEIEGQAVDESFTSSPGGFDSVREVSALQFPASVPGNTVLMAELESARSTARIAMGVAIAGMLLGLGGLIAGLLALRGRAAAARHDAATVASR
jgi:hypothetical protein